MNARPVLSVSLNLTYMRNTSDTISIVLQCHYRVRVKYALPIELSSLKYCFARKMQTF